MVPSIYFCVGLWCVYGGGVQLDLFGKENASVFEQALACIDGELKCVFIDAEAAECFGNDDVGFFRKLCIQRVFIDEGYFV